MLGIVDAASNGVGSDAVILIYDAKAKSVVSINAEGTAPRLATIEWYQKNLGGKLPQSDTLLSGTVPGVVDAWYTLLDRWGTMTFAQVLQPAIDTAENGFPVDTTGQLIGTPKSDGAFSDEAELTALLAQSDDVKKSWLRPLASTEDIWCQLFSEPGAGSDLAPPLPHGRPHLRLPPRARRRRGLPCGRLRMELAGGH